MFHIIYQSSTVTTLNFHGSYHGDIPLNLTFRAHCHCRTDILCGAYTSSVVGRGAVWARESPQAAILAFKRSRSSRSFSMLSCLEGLHVLLLVVGKYGNSWIFDSLTTRNQQLSCFYGFQPFPNKAYISYSPYRKSYFTYDISIFYRKYLSIYACKL